MAGFGYVEVDKMKSKAKVPHAFHRALIGLLHDR